MSKSFSLSRDRRSGSILIITLVAIVLLSLCAYTFTAMMIVEEEASRLITRKTQSKYLVHSGVDYLRLYLSHDEPTIKELGGKWDNEGPDEFSGFRMITVGVDPANPELKARFSVLSPGMDEEGYPISFRYGLVDESSKINLNTLPFADSWVPNGGQGFLMALPEMTPEIADAILDWIDGDNEIRPNGTESAYYSGLEPAYACKNGPMDSIDELLLVKGVTPELLFGADMNRNGIIDPIELQGQNVTSLEADMLLGWANYLTLYSKESNVNADGLARVNINNPDLEQLATDLSASLNPEWTNFIIQYRLTGPYVLAEGEEVDPEALEDWELPDLDSAEAPFTYTQPLDLIDAYTKTADGIIVPSPVRMETIVQTMSVLMDSVTTFEGQYIPGRINIAQAPRRVLEAIPGLQNDEEAIDLILQYREYEPDEPDLADVNKKYGTWLLTDGFVDLPTMRLLFPFVCTDGDVYSGEIVGYFDDGIGNSRAEVMIDTTSPIPRILSLRDKSHVQAGYSLEVLGTDYVEN